MLSVRFPGVAVALGRNNTHGFGIHHDVRTQALQRLGSDAVHAPQFVDGLEGGFLALTIWSPQRIFRNGQDKPRPVTHVLHAIALITESAWPGKLHPPIVLTLVHITRWAALLYVARNVHCCRASLRNYEGVINDDVLRAEILRSVHAAIRLLERRVSGVDRIIGTLECLLTGER